MDHIIYNETQSQENRRYNKRDIIIGNVIFTVIFGFFFQDLDFIYFQTRKFY